MNTKSCIILLACFLAVPYFLTGADAFVSQHAVCFHQPGQRTNLSFFAKADSRQNEEYASSTKEEEEVTGLRLNKVFKATHSRRQADALIAQGRVTVNDGPAETRGGHFVVPYRDVVKLDGEVVTGWEKINAISDEPSSPSLDLSTFEYVKYWKPCGVICTTDRKIAHNILDEMHLDGYRPKHRVYPVGRLDKETSGLILLTSDGRLPNASLRSKQKRAKTYQVVVDRPIGDDDIEHLQNGVVITTVAQRDRNVKKALTAATLPCVVNRIDDRAVQMTLQEGRNRQIRKMMAALDFEVVDLFRTDFMGIGLEPLGGPGDWARLNENEMELVRATLLAASGPS